MELTTKPQTEWFAGAGATLSVCDDDGVTLFQVPLAPGVHDATKYRSLNGVGYLIGDNVLEVSRGQRPMVPARAPGALRSGANPDFTPSSVDNAVKQLQMQIDKMAKNQKFLERKEAAREKRRAEREAEREAERALRREQRLAEREAEAAAEAASQAAEAAARQEADAPPAEDV